MNVQALENTIREHGKATNRDYGEMIEHLDKNRQMPSSMSSKSKQEKQRSVDKIQLHLKLWMSVKRRVSS